ncbi:HAD hydrolase-like protein [Aquibacillus sp. 3ASR75-11]|uniref:HAD hydrolase-like protein n=1 Tax=Terrihalobacillus insolitus TaxID=2950438 RepID=A0A9X3WTM5_9BACI|nr:HAD hydrolase-like protein [Terrihalobacillus insolitus]MDC3423661.1 HAD hydrolase-like protein [Terrihalobacillus insolitus]
MGLADRSLKEHYLTRLYHRTTIKEQSFAIKKALEQLHVSANESIFVGDHPENDVKAAQHIGMTGVWKKDVQWGNAEADFIIDDLTELPNIVEKLNELNW